MRLRRRCDRAKVGCGVSLTCILLEQDAHPATIPEEPQAEGELCLRTMSIAGIPAPSTSTVSKKCDAEVKTRSSPKKSPAPSARIPKHYLAGRCRCCSGSRHRADTPAKQGFDVTVRMV